MINLRPCPVTGLTERQYRFLVLVQEYQRKHRIAPSYDELAQAMGLSRRISAQRFVKLLEPRGFLSHAHGARRSLAITPKGQRAIARYIGAPTDTVAQKAS